MSHPFRGVGVALITPFKTDKTIDYVALGALVDYVTAGGVDYLVALGTTAETPTLTFDEKQQIATFVRERNAGRLPLMIGIGGNCTDEVIRNIDRYDTAGYDAILSVTPYYNRPSQAGLFEHYRAIAEVSSKPVVLYNVPSRTGVNMTAETTLKLAHATDRIIGVKEASGNLAQAAYILRDRPNDFLVISGDDNLALPMIALGGDGVISVASNAFPQTFSQMIGACLAGDFAKAAPIQLALQEPVDALFAEGNPVGVKLALAIKGMIANELRLPLVAGSDGLRERLSALIAKYGL